jgi:tRNA-modifying protein YgfZ
MPKELHALRIYQPTSEQYRAVREGTAIVDRSGRGRLLVTGDDRRTYLQGLLTNDISALTPGTGCYAAYLTAQGRMISDMRVFDLEDAILLDLEGFAAAAVRDRLTQFIFNEDVEVSDLSAAKTQIGVYGPNAAAAVARLFASAGGAAASRAAAAARLGAMAMLASELGDIGGTAVYVLRGDDIGVEGFDLIADAALASELKTQLVAGGATAVDAAVAETTRIEAGRPRFGVDMTEDTIPLEAGIEDRAISRTKGCYVGQEIIIRVLDRGHGRVARRLVGLKLSSPTLPSRGEAIRSGDRDIGQVTSATHSPMLETSIALGYVHRDFAMPGTVVAVGGHPATVVETPFV